MQYIFHDMTSLMENYIINSHMMHMEQPQGELYQQFPYDMCETATACLVEELDMPVPLDNGCMCSFLTKHFYDMYIKLH